jgi:stage V sporulation protein G
MKITKLEINLIKPNQGLIGFANIVLEGQLFVGSIGIHSKLNGKGYRLTYPSRKVGDQNITIFHPVKLELSRIIEEAIEVQISKLLPI